MKDTEGIKTIGDFHAEVFHRVFTSGKLPERGSFSDPINLKRIEIFVKEYNREARKLWRELKKKKSVRLGY